MGKPMRILIGANAVKGIKRETPPQMGFTSAQMSFHGIIRQLQGKWVEVETDYCFEDQFNTPAIEGVTKMGLRIHIESVVDVDFGDLGYEGWKQKVTNWESKSFKKMDKTLELARLNQNK